MNNLNEEDVCEQYLQSVCLRPTICRNLSRPDLFATGFARKAWSSRQESE
jgi:hypothetical protein